MMRLVKPAFWIIFALTMAIYLTMLLWSLPAIATAADNLAPFDMRPTGYSFEEAKAFLSALPPDMADFYRKTQSGLLDTFYPALLGLTLFLAIGLLAQSRLGNWAWALALVAIPGAVFDYMENVNIRLMLFLGPDNITPEIVARASNRTEWKALASTAAMSILLILLVLWLWSKLRPKRIPNG